MTNQVLQKLVEMRGVETHYVDAWGNPATISEASKAKLLQALGYDILCVKKLQHPHKVSAY